MTIVALVVAAGRGERLSSEQPKALVSLGGKPLVAHAVEALARCRDVETVIPVVPAEARDAFEALRGEIEAAGKLGPSVVGGAERQDSVSAGLEALGRDVALVVIHDAARPLVLPADVSRTVAAAQETGAAILAVPVSDTIKRVRAGEILETPPREECWAAQTPQVFRVELLRKALHQAEEDGFRGTDDAELVERIGIRVRVVEGSRSNLKITWPEDLALAEEILRARFEPGRAR